MEYVQLEHSVQVEGRTVTVRSRTPVFASRDEREDTKDKIEKRLYEIFKKYMP